MSKEFKILINYMSYIANTMNYKSWDYKQVGKEYMEKLKNAKEQFANEKLDFSKLSDEEYKLLRFQDWDEDTKNLIPLWLFRILPDNTKVISFSGSKEVIAIADDDVRFGCTAYMLYLTTNT